VTDQMYLDPTQDQGRDFVMRGIKGSVVMLNLLRLRAIADYSIHPELAPASPVTGEEAYRRYMERTLSFLKASGGELLFCGQGVAFLVGPGDEEKRTSAQGEYRPRTDTDRNQKPRLVAGASVRRVAFASIDYCTANAAQTLLAASSSLSNRPFSETTSPAARSIICRPA